MNLAVLSQEELDKYPLEDQVKLLRDCLENTQNSFFKLLERVEQINRDLGEEMGIKSYQLGVALNQLDNSIDGLNNEFVTHINNPHTILITSKKEGDKNESNIP